MAKMYMHLLDGEPANFDPLGKYIYFVPTRGKVKLVKNLYTIRNQQEECKSNKKYNSFYQNCKYSYRMVEVPDNDD